MSTKQKVIVGFVALVVLFVALLLWWRSSETPVTNVPSASAQARAAVATVTNAAERTATSAAQAGTSASAQPLATQKPSSELKRTFEALNDNPIEFYGRALDQYGEPVTGAEVTGSVLYNTGVKSGRKITSTTTDAGGYFRFSELKGQTLGIDFKKSGYEFNPRNTLFSYSYFEAEHKRHIPDRQNPVIFTLWKKQGAEALVHYNKTFWQMPADGTPVKLNLANGRIGDTGADMIVSITRTPLRMRYGERGYRVELARN